MSPNLIRVVGGGSAPAPEPLAVEATASSVEATEVTSHSHTLPAGVEVGDLLIAIVRVGRDRAISSPPGGWKEELSIGTDAQAITYFYSRVATGSDAFSFGTDDTCLSACIIYRISGAAVGQGSYVEADGFVDDVTHATPDPPSLAPSWPTAETLWIAYAAVLRGTTTIDSAPANYGSLDETATTDPLDLSTSEITVGSAHRFNEAASEDPGAFSLTDPDGTNRPVAATIAVRPQ